MKQPNWTKSKDGKLRADFRATTRLDQETYTTLRKIQEQDGYSTMTELLQHLLKMAIIGRIDEVEQEEGHEDGQEISH